MRVFGAIIDCADPVTLAGFWSRLLQCPVATQRPEWATVKATNLSVSFQRVPEPKLGKNRVHLDLDVASIEEAVDHALACGATVVSDLINEGEGSFRVMQDPEGNEFCFVSGYSI